MKIVLDLYFLFFSSALKRPAIFNRAQVSKQKHSVIALKENQILKSRLCYCYSTHKVQYRTVIKGCDRIGLDRFPCCHEKFWDDWTVETCGSRSGLSQLVTVTPDRTIKSCIDRWQGCIKVVTIGRPKPVMTGQDCQKELVLLDKTVVVVLPWDRTFKMCCNEIVGPFFIITVTGQNGYANL